MAALYGRGGRGISPYRRFSGNRAVRSGRSNAASRGEHSQQSAARSSRKEFGQFLSVARGSLSELDTQLDLSEELSLISSAARREFDPILIRVDQMLYVLQERQKRAVVFR